jgi:hypothetical protein
MHLGLALALLLTVAMTCVNAAIVSTFAGSGQLGGSDGQGTNASFITPHAISIDSTGNLLVSESRLVRIRKITPAGIVTTATAWNLAAMDIIDRVCYVILVSALDSHDNIILLSRTGDIYNLTQNDTSPIQVVRYAALDALPWSIPSISSIVIDSSNNIYTSDIQNNVVYKIASDGIASVYAGGGDLDAPHGPAHQISLMAPTLTTLDHNGNLIVVDTYNKRVRRVTADGIIETVAGFRALALLERHALCTDGPASVAMLGAISGIACDEHGNIFVVDACLLYTSDAADDM